MVVRNRTDPTAAAFQSTLSKTATPPASWRRRRASLSARAVAVPVSDTPRPSCFTWNMRHLKRGLRAASPSGTGLGIRFGSRNGQHGRARIAPTRYPESGPCRPMGYGALRGRDKQEPYGPPARGGRLQSAAQSLGGAGHPAGSRPFKCRWLGPMACSAPLPWACRCSGEPGTSPRPAWRRGGQEF
jgi:hypothetical protein